MIASPAGVIESFDRVRVIDSHTGGEPTRLVIDGGPDLGTGSLAQRREAYREDPDPHFQTFGPKTRSEFLSNLKARGGAAI